MVGNQLAQWLSAQPGNMAGDLQHNVRALTLRASNHTPVSDGHEEVASLRKHLQHQQQLIMKCRPCLRNKLWRCDRDYPKQVAHGWPRRACIRCQDSLTVRGLRVGRTPCAAFWIDSLQRQCDGQLRSHVHALQDECRDHVGQEEEKLRKELQQALSQESNMCRDQLHQALRHQACQEGYADAMSTREMDQLRRMVTEQEDAMLRLETTSKHNFSRQYE